MNEEKNRKQKTKALIQDSIDDNCQKKNKNNSNHNLNNSNC